MKPEKNHLLSPLRNLLKKFHPEGIPWPGTLLYNAISSTGIFQRHYELVAGDIINYYPAGKILDIGTGPGWLLEKIYRISPESEITGLDISFSMVEKARKNMINSGLSGLVEVMQGEACKIPFNDSYFDIITSTGSMHHWKNPTAALNEIYRVLKPGGHALLYDLVSDTPDDIIKKAAIEFGRLKMFLLWLHAFEEPFYSHKNFHMLAEPTLFRKGETRFVGVMLCLTLRK